MSDSFSSPVFHVNNFSANNNLRFKYTMPSPSIKTRSRSGGSSSSSGIGGSPLYSKALSIIPYTSSYDTTMSSKSPRSPSSSSLSRHYTTPLPSLSISTAAESLLLGTMKSALISPGSARAMRYTRSSSASVVNGSGAATLEVQRISSNSYALLTPEGPRSPSGSGSATGTGTPRSPLSMFPIMSKSLLRYRHHSFSRSPSISSRRCGSVDPEIYRRVSLSRQISNYSTISSSTTSALERKALSQSRSHSASCSNSRSGSVERYTSSSSSSSATRKQHHSGPGKVYSRESSYALLGTNNNDKLRSSGNGFVNDGISESNAVAHSTSATVQCVTELARNVALHQWDSESTTRRREMEDENDENLANVNKLDSSSGKYILNGNSNGSIDHDENMPEKNGHDHHEKETLHDDGGVGVGISASSNGVRELSRQSSVATTSELDSCASTTSTTTLVPAEKSATISNGVNGYATHDIERKSSANDTVNGYGNRRPPPPPPPILAVAQSTTTTSKRITTAIGTVTTKTTDIIDMKFVNGFVHLMGSNGTASTSSLDRISTPSRSTRQRIRLAKNCIVYTCILAETCHKTSSSSPKGVKLFSTDAEE